MMIVLFIGCNLNPMPLGPSLIYVGNNFFQPVIFIAVFADAIPLARVSENAISSFSPGVGQVSSGCGTGLFGIGPSVTFAAR
jgi:hypothetical protein